MARARSSVQKRRNEARKLEKAQEKAASKAQRAAQREARSVEHEGSGDPDLAGIVAGPQPPLEAFRD